MASLQSLLIRRLSDRIALWGASPKGQIFPFEAVQSASDIVGRPSLPQEGLKNLSDQALEGQKFRSAVPACLPIAWPQAR